MEAVCASVLHVLRCYPVRLVHRRLEFISAQKSGQEGSSPDVSAASGIPHPFGTLCGRDSTAGRPRRRHPMPGLGPKERVALESGARDVPGSTGTQCDGNQFQLGTDAVGR